MKGSAELVSMAGRTVLVTGAVAGIGHATALRFADGGADLLLVDINPDAMGKVVDEIKALGRRVHGHVLQSRLAFGRWGQPDEVARVALFLASRLASYVQGAMIPVDGGFLST